MLCGFFGQNSKVIKLFVFFSQVNKVGGYASFFHHAQHLGWHFHPLLNPIQHHRHGVKVVLEGTTGSIFGMRDVVSVMRNSWIFKFVCHRGRIVTGDEL